MDSSSVTAITNQILAAQTGPAKEGVATSEYKSMRSVIITTALGILSSAAAGLIPFLTGHPDFLKPALIVALTLIGCMTATTIVYIICRSWVKVSALRSSVTTTLKTSLITFALLSTLFLSGCGGDARMAAAAQGAADRENNCIKNHMAIHAAEQQAIIDANNKLIQQRQDAMTAQTIAAANANKAITPAQIVADLQRTNMEAQQFRDQTLANIRNLQSQIASYNADHDQAQQLLSAVINFENTPGPSLTQIATQTTNILTPVLTKANAASSSSSSTPPPSAIVPDSAAPPTSTAVAVPGQ